MKKLLGITGICLWAILAGGCRQDSSSGRFEEPEEIVTDFVSEYEIAEVSPGEAMKIPAGICQLDDLIIVCDKGNHRIQIWNSSFNYVDQIILEPLTHAQGGRNYIDLAMDKEGCIYVSTDSVGEPDCYIYVIENEKISQIETPFVGYLEEAQGDVYAVNSMELYKEKNTDGGASGSNSVYRIENKKLVELYQLPNKFTPNDFCVENGNLYVISALWGQLSGLSLKTGEITPVIMLEYRSFGHYLEYISESNMFWLSDTENEKLYRIYKGG
ncbi:MAG TPA: hypothetical protein IAB23_06830 [Candidatus Scybalocola faecavium]|nr:hypothetical protein [Candidatus Scybalocola faecavium]